MTLKDTFTSTGSKFFAHQEAMQKLRNGAGQPIVTHVMLTDVCNHTCAFCSVQKRPGDSLIFDDVMCYLDILKRYGLKAVILSGGGNPILYRCKETGANFNDVVNAIWRRGLEIGLITNGMPLRSFEVEKELCCPICKVGRGCPSVGLTLDTRRCTNCGHCFQVRDGLRRREMRESWGTVRPETLDKLTWVRISMAGLDHDEEEVYVPDIDPTKTALGFSYVAHDIYQAPEDPHHGKVSTESDMLALGIEKYKGIYRDRRLWFFEDRVKHLTDQITHYVKTYKPRYVRLLPNCLEPRLITYRCSILQEMAQTVNMLCGNEVAFVQNKPPQAPHACYLGYIHPVLNCDGYIYPCDSCVLNETADHQFANPWRVCKWQDIAQIYDRPVRSLIADPAKTCPGCVFTRSNEILKGVVDGAEIATPLETLEHVNFV